MSTDFVKSATPQSSKNTTPKPVKILDICDSDVSAKGKNTEVQVIVMIAIVTVNYNGKLTYAAAA